MDRPLIRRATLRQRLREQVETAYPDKLTTAGEINLARQRLLDAVNGIPSAGLAKVRDIRAFLRAAERARELTSSEQFSRTSLLRDWPMTLADDTLLKRVPELDLEPQPSFGNPTWLRYTRRKFEDSGVWDWADPVNDTVTGDMLVTYDFGQVDFMVDSQDAFETTYTQDPDNPKRPGVIQMYWATEFSEPLTWVLQVEYPITEATGWSTDLIEVPGPTSLARRIRFVWEPD